MTTTTQTGREPLEIALDANPEYRKLQAAEAVVQKRASELSFPETDFTGEALASLDKGDPIPTDIGRRLWERNQEREIVQAELGLMRTLADRLKNERENAFRDGATTALRALRPVLDELLDEAQPMAALLIGVHDAQTAIDRGPKTVDAWTRFAELTNQYKRIRDAQAKLTRAAGSEDAPPLVWAEVSNVTDVWPQWNPNKGDRKPQTPPWPTANPNREFHVQHGREWLMWLMTTPGVKVWLPTPDETAAASRAQAADAKERGGKPKDRSGEPRRVPTRYRDMDGHTWTEWQKIEA
ncbi:hypothetical protein [Streptomyces sp. NPDC058254]|uniref:hypothetical protein n=1 Tax=Streptomyces sp. NPDC058254 TaxID=3346406 RepID=UPI0036E7A973